MARTNSSEFAPALPRGPGQPSGLDPLPNVPKARRARSITPAWLSPEVTQVFWQSKDRHYTLTIGPNLWNELEICQQWGGRCSGRGNFKITPVSDRQQAMEILRLEALRRARRGYAVRSLSRNDALHTQ